MTAPAAAPGRGAGGVPGARGAGAARGAAGRRPGDADRRGGARAWPTATPGGHLQDRQQGRGPDHGRRGPRGGDRRRDGAAGRPARHAADRARTGTAWSWPRPAWTPPTPGRAPCCCCPRTRTPRPARCAPDCATRSACDVGVVVTDTFGRPWRDGLTDIAIGAAGLRRAARPARRRRHPRQRARADRDRHSPTSWPPPATWSRARLRRPGGRGARAGRTLVLAEDGAGRPGAGPRRGRRHVPARHRRGASGWRSTAAAHGAGVHRRAGRPGRGAPGGRRGGHRAGAAPHHAVALRAAGVAPPRATRLLDAMRDAWTADLRGDGFTEEAIARRMRRGDVLRGGAVPGRALPGRRTALARLPGRAAGGGGARDVPGRDWAPPCRTCWSRWPARGWARPGSPRRCSAATWCARCSTCRRGWDPMGAVAVGRPAAAPAARPARDAAAFTVTR